MWLILATAALVAIAAIARTLERSWAAPGAFFALVWVVAAAPATVIIPQVVSAEAVLFVTTFIVAVLAGSQLATGGYARLEYVLPLCRESSDPPARAPECRTLLVTTVLLALCGFAAFVGYVWEAGYALKQLTNSGVWLDMAVHYSVARYRQNFTEPAPLLLLLAMNYGGSITGGLVLASSRSLIPRLAALLPIVAGSLITVATTAKAGMLLTATFTFAGWLSLRTVLRPDSVRVFSARRWLAVAGIGAIVAGVATVSLVLRYGGDDSDWGFIGERIGGYVFGHMAALSAWLLVENWSGLTRTWGALSFSGLWSFFGLSDRIPGVYVEIGVNDWAAQTNVFTAFRGLVGDFGIFGAWFIASLLGALGGYCYQRLRCREGGTLSIVALTVFYSATAWSPIISIFSYNVILLAIATATCASGIAWPEISDCIDYSLRWRMGTVVRAEARS